MSDPGKTTPKSAVVGAKKEPPARDGFMSLVSFWEQSGDAPGLEPVVDPLDQLREMEAEIERRGEQIVADARAEATRIEEEAYQKGFARGEEEGRSQGKNGFDQAVQRLEMTLAAMEGQLAKENSRYQEELLLLVTTMVDRLVQHEVSTNPRVIQACLMRALSFVVEKSVVKVHLHPDDFSRIREASLENPSLLEGKRRIELMEDGSIAEGGCFLETDFGDVDASMEHGREKLYEAVDRAFRLSLAEGEGAAASDSGASADQQAGGDVPVGASVADADQDRAVPPQAQEPPAAAEEVAPGERSVDPDPVVE